MENKNWEEFKDEWVGKFEKPQEFKDEGNGRFGEFEKPQELKKFEDRKDEGIGRFEEFEELKEFEEFEGLEEYQYLNVLRNVSQFGIEKPNRTKNNTKSIFGNMMKFTLYEIDETNSEIVYKRILPLLTTKNMSKSSKIIFEELIFFVKGQTNNKILKDKGVHIWDANGSRQFLDSIGLNHFEEDDLGEIYGAQWRHFGANYINCHTDYTNQGIDQLQWVIDEIKRNPYSRRLIVSSWNPLALKNMCLPPCHTMFQFNVEPDLSGDLTPKFLSCSLYQRSCDLPLGCPFNIASYATLTHIIADLTGLIAKEFIYFTADTHIYCDQLPLISEQISRKPYPFPNLEFDFENNSRPTKIDDWEAKYLKVTNYKHHPTIRYPFSV